MLVGYQRYLVCIFSANQLSIQLVLNECYCWRAALEAKLKPFDLRSDHD